MFAIYQLQALLKTWNYQTTYMFFDYKVLDTFHDKLRAMTHQFGEHAYSLGSSSSVLTRSCCHLGEGSVVEYKYRNLLKHTNGKLQLFTSNTNTKSYVFSAPLFSSVLFSSLDLLTVRNLCTNWLWRFTCTRSQYSFVWAAKGLSHQEPRTKNPRKNINFQNKQKLR